jgi:hypothetical protein
MPKERPRLGEVFTKEGHLMLPKLVRRRESEIRIRKQRRLRRLGQRL